MRPERSIQIVAILVVVFLPLIALAGPTASVTVAPFGRSAPTVNIVLLGLLAVVLSVAAATVLRKRPPMLRAGMVIAVALTLAAIGQAANVEHTVSGDECLHPTVKSYFPGGVPTLKSECENPIVIVDKDINCGGEPPPCIAPACVVGLVLNSGDYCNLDTCN